MLFSSCFQQNQTKMNINHSYTNQLIHETSPYLLQHAHNPVNWYPWNEETLALAKKENKPLLISIGYSACHWCHVMEKECFENEEVAKIMNEYFINIKVDREERPDIDHIYMNAVQLMTERGGWPLNCFALPDGRPFYGGTYFPKDNWINVLTQLHQQYHGNYNKVVAYAEEVSKGVKSQEEIFTPSPSLGFDKEVITLMTENWKKQFDTVEGGANRAPKFPLPNNYEFLLQYYYHTKDEEVGKHILNTLHKMARGGIYDQLGGGFARYSVDNLWKVPHFEKMLYDNAQLISLYSHAFQLFKDEEFKKIVYETTSFIERELLDKTGAFYSALDADSEGEEGKFYVWTKEDLQQIIGEDFNLFAELYQINTKGYWENGNYILIRNQSYAEFAESKKLSIDLLYSKIDEWKKKLMIERDKRVRPSLDDKTLTSWNALATKSLAEAYLAFNDPYFLNLALQNADFLTKHQIDNEGKIWHNYKNETSNINGYLEDYCFVAEAFIALYQATFDESWLQLANKIAKYAIQHFYSEDKKMFYFTSDTDAKLFVRTIDYQDNVIPSTNSTMANVLFILGKYFNNQDYLDKSSEMLNAIQPYLSSYGSGYSNWAILYLKQIHPHFEVAFAGKEAKKIHLQWQKHFIPNQIVMGCVSDNTDIDLLKNKFSNDNTMIYVCIDKTCKMPTNQIEQALKQISSL
jgi:uncharacterized protein